MTPARPDPGHYELKQLRSSVIAIRLSHRGRFRMARRLVEPFAGRTLLDYGCGDGAFLSVVSDLFPAAVGTDFNSGQIADCRRRFDGVLPTVSFRDVAELRAPEFAHRFGVVTCMEVLEHCVAADVDVVLDKLSRLVAPDGIAIVSVPIEIGPSLIVKQALRVWAGWRRIGDYQYAERYRISELLTMVLATRRARIARPVYSAGPSDGWRYHGHKGFNWRALRDRIGENFTVQETRFSPLGSPAGLLDSQAWFICRPRDGRRSAASR